MYNAGRMGWWVVALLAVVLAGGLYLLEQSYTAGEPSTSVAATSTNAIAHPALISDLYPPYPGVAWGASSPEQVTISTTTYAGASISAVATTSTMDPGSAFMPFDAYYEKALTQLGWSVDNTLAAGGPMGGQTGYRKAGAVILARFSVVYHTNHADAPSECPCDVTLSLFSTR